MKYVTMSYDDGVLQDIRFLEILNKYGIKATFNINYGILSTDSFWETKGVEVRRVTKEVLTSSYTNHEIAGHSFDHPSLVDLDDDMLKHQIETDKNGLEQLMKEKIYGFAYPFGTYNGTVIRALRNAGYKYARTVDDTFGFEYPKELMKWHPTCHHNHSEIFELIEAFSQQKEGLFYIWGHSYEFETDHNWDHLELLCQKLSQLKDVEFVTNIEFLKKTSLI